MLIEQCCSDSDHSRTHRRRRLGLLFTALFPRTCTDLVDSDFNRASLPEATATTSSSSSSNNERSLLLVREHKSFKVGLEHKAWSMLRQYIEYTRSQHFYRRSLCNLVAVILHCGELFDWRRESLCTRHSESTSQRWSTARQTRWGLWLQGACRRKAPSNKFQYPRTGYFIVQAATRSVGQSFGCRWCLTKDQPGFSDKQYRRSEICYGSPLRLIFCFETMRAVRRWHRSSKRQNVHIARQALRRELLDALGDQQQQDSVISWGLSHLTKTIMSSSWSSKCHSQMAATTKKKNGYTPGRVWWSAPAVFEVWYMDSGYETKVMRWDW